MTKLADQWPSLPFDAWENSYATLHRWTQIVGKIRLVQMPWINHSWHVPLYVTVSGLTTSPIPHGGRTFEIAFDFLEHRLLIRTSDGDEEVLPLRRQSVAGFYAELLGKLAEMEIGVAIHGSPNELEDATPFADDQSHNSYDPAYAARFWRVLIQADRVFQEFRARFIGKSSPVHFFWGSFDLAVTRFSGRTAPPHPGGIPNLPDWVVREAYSHEVSSCGFWPGGGPHPFPLFYSYAYPEPEGFASASIESQGAFYSDDLREWVLPYDLVRTAASPANTLLRFLENSYAAAADLGHWDRSMLERSEDPRTAF
ncbi:MAG: DUF5996 family protein [Longimicrobiaceae bacterium]